MRDLATDRFTVGVFKDVASAEKGIGALERHGFPPQALSLIAVASPEVEAFAARVFGGKGQAAEVKNLGSALVHGPLIAVLNGNADDFPKLGIAATAGRAGFQQHDGVIFERLTARGGILIGVSSEGRASDAVATLHAYGGGNAAIGAWTGRV
ncbi:MAG TPA: hypothetical protein VK886_17270 [Vicinamibacterales bacterium]|nr:hypothetical protein [Vicinamibacterales bacterium]